MELKVRDSFESVRDDHGAGGRDVSLPSLDHAQHPLPRAVVAAVAPRVGEPRERPERQPPHSTLITNIYSG